MWGRGKARLRGSQVWDRRQIHRHKNQPRRYLPLSLSYYVFFLFIDISQVVFFILWSYISIILQHNSYLTLPNFLPQLTTWHGLIPLVYISWFILTHFYLVFRNFVLAYMIWRQQIHQVAGRFPLTNWFSISVEIAPLFPSPLMCWFIGKLCVV